MSRDFRKRFWSSFVWSLTLFAMVLNTLFPAFEALRQVRAQEVTPEPTPEVTAEATADPTQEVTLEPTIEATVEATPTPIEEATLEVTAEVVTETPLPVLPTLPPPTAEVSLFVDNFQDAGSSLVANGWSLSGGWTIGSEAGSDGTTNFYLSAAPTGVNETATLPQIQWADLTLAARVRVGGNDAAAITVRAGVESYTVFVTGSGAVQLYRGAIMVAEGPVVVTPEPILPGTDATAEPAAPAVWRTVNIQVENDTVTVLLEGVPQISYTDPTPVGTGSIGFSAGSLNAGSVDFDDIVISRLMPPVQPTVEATAEVTAEATAEATEIPADGVLLREDFQADLAQWNFSTDVGIVSAGDEGNQVLLMPSGGTLTPLNALVLADFRLDVRANLVTTESGGVQITLRDGYTLTIDATQTTLTRGETVVATSVTAHDAATWYAVSITMERDHIVVIVNDTIEIDVIDAEPTLAGGIGFSAVGVVQLDDVVVTDLTSQEVLAEVTPSPTPLGIDDATRAKIDGALVSILNTFLSGDVTTFAQDAATFGIFVDDSGRVRVVLRAANLANGETLRASIEGTGGIVEQVVENTVTALIPPMGIIALAGTAEIEVILLPDATVSTDYSAADTASVAEAVGSVVPQSLDIISVPDWNAAAIRGADIDIAVIDSNTGGFVGAVAGSGAGGGNQQCLYAVEAGSTTSHGTSVVDVICDIAPNSRVYGYLAATATELTSTINTLRTTTNVAGIAGNTFDIILITMDAGANVSAGDGTGNGMAAGTDFYAAISAARTSGIFVVASAGNNNGRYQSFTLPSDNAPRTVTMTAPVGARVNISWSAWSSAADISASLTGPGAKPVRGSGVAGHSFIVTSANPTLTVSNNSGGALTIQVQVTGATSAITGGTAVFLNTTGNLARPADSPDVIAVGAVCANQSARYPRLSDSSIGPVFTAGGVGPNNSTAGVDIKPDVVAPSHVSTQFAGAAANCVIPVTVGANNIATPITGFNGTSAAAAHVAGMAALLRSNTLNDSMNTRVGPGLQNAPAELERYIQTHTVDLYNTTIAAGENPPAGTPDGWDRNFGAGLTMLGSPTFNMADVQNFSNATTHDVNTFYVGQANLSSTQVGDSTNPYLSIADAVADHPGQRVVVMSGEYVSGINVAVAGTAIVSFDSADIVNRPDTSIWVNDTFFNITPFGGSSAGINVNDVNNVTIDGFVFNSAHPLYLAGPAPILGIPRAVAGNAVAGFTLQNSTFNNFAAGVRLDIDGTTTVTGNTFTNFSLPQGSFETSVLAVIGLIGSGGDDVVNVTRNTFSGNVNPGGSADDNFPRQAIAYLTYARINFYSNRMYNNRSEAMVTINQWEEVNNSSNNTRSFAEARIFSSSFTNNQIINSDALSVVNLYQGSQFRFVNNTVAGSDLSLGNRASFITVGGVGSPASHFNGVLGGDAYLHEFEIHNNVFYNNTFGGGASSRNLITFTNGAVNLGCFNIGAPGVADQGAHNNWFIYMDLLGNDASRPDQGQCDDATNTPANGNVFTELPSLADKTNFEAANFFGIATDPIDPYRLRPTSTQGIDGGNDAYVTGIFDNPLTVPVDIQPDALGLTRIVVRLGGAPDIDLGAYELSDPQPLVVSGPQNVVGAEDTPFIPFQLGAGVVTGGILPLRYTVTSAPANYNASATGPCSGVPVQHDQASNQAAYCPPADFYSYPAGGGIVTFNYTVTDALGEASATGTVNINVTSVGDANDGGLFGTVANPQVVFTSVLTPTNYRLRPYFDFNNFRLSDPTIERGQDYPFTFSNATYVSGNATLLGPDQTATMAAVNAALATANSNGGYLVLNPIPGNTGELIFTYNVSDGTGENFAAAGRVRLIVTQRLAGIGLHDDVSLDFVYTGAWAPYYFETANNNSMHFTSTLDDQLDFYFSGDTFILNMYGLPSSGNFEVSIDPDGDGGVEDFQAPSDAGLTCSPEIAPGTGIVAGVRTVATFYSVGCRGLSTDFSNSVHILRITNKSVGRFVFIDSIEIRGPSLAGGYYEERDFSLTYTGTWLNLASTGPKGGSERYTSTLGSTITFQYDAATADAIVLYHTVVPGWGTMRVCASGGGCINVVQNGTTLQWGKRRWISDTELNIGGSTGIHTITISPTIGNQVIGLESLYIHSQPNSLGAPLTASPTPYEDVNSSLYYIGRWSFLGNPQTFGGSAQLTTDPSASVMFNIDNTAYGIAVYRTTSAGWANMEICIDSQCQTFLNGGATIFGDTAVLRVGTPGPHVVEIRNTAALNFDVEAIRVLGIAGPLGIGFYQETEASTDFNLVYSGAWTNLAVASLVGGTARYTLSTASTVRFDIDATVVDRIGIYRIQSPVWGDFNVCASGGNCVLVDNSTTYSALGRLQIIGLDELGIDGSTLVHTITIRSVTNGRAAGIEALELRGPQTALAPGYYEEKQLGTNMNLIFSGTWLDSAYVGPRGGSLRYATATASTVSFIYDPATSDDIAVYYPVATGWGTLRVCPGAAPCININESGTTLHGQRRWITVAELGNPGAPITVTMSSTVNGQFVGLDALYIHAASNGLGTLAANATPYEETNSAFRYIGTWTTQTVAQYVGGTSKFTNDPGASIMFNIDGSASGIAVYRTAGPTWGPVQICIDAVCQTYGGRTVIVYGDIVSSRATNPGPHVVEIRNVGPTLLGIEAVRVLGATTPLGIGFYEDGEASANFNLTYNGNWNFLNIPGMIGNNAHYTTSSSSSLSFDIDTNIVKRIVLFRTTAPTGWSNFEVCAEGITPCATVVNTSPAIAFGVPQVLTLANLNIVANGVYTITITPTTNAASASIEALQLVGAQGALAPGYYDATEIGSNFNLTFNGTWTNFVVAGPRGGSERYTNNVGNTATFTYDGTNSNGILLYFTKTVGRGQLHVCGTICATDTDQNSASTLWAQRRWFTEAELGIAGAQNYVITISSATNGLNAGIDAFYIHGNNSIGAPLTVSGTPYQENNASLRYVGTWTTSTFPSFNGGTAAVTSDPSAAIMFNIDSAAAGVAVYRAITAAAGPTEVCVDNTCETFSGIGPTVFGDTAALWRGGIPGGQHFVEIRSKTAVASYVEAIQVVGAFSPLAIGYYEETGQSTGFNLTYTGPWSNWVNAGTLGGTARLVSLAGATATFRVDANAMDRIVIFHTNGLNWGTLNVCSELVGGLGDECVLINTNATTTVYGVATIITKAQLGIDTSANIHNITITSTTAAPVNIEALQILGVPGNLGLGYYEETEIATSFNLVYNGTWLPLTTPAAQGGTARYTTSTASTATFTIDSNVVTRLAIFRTTGPGWSDMQVCNGVTCVTATNNVGTAVVYRVPFLMNTSALGAGTFTVTIKSVTNGQPMSIEALQLLGAPGPLAPGYYEETEASTSFGLTYSAGWSTLSGSGPRAGTLRYANSTSSTITFSYDVATSNGIIIYHPMFVSWGDLRVCSSAPTANCFTVDQNSVNNWNRRTWIDEGDLNMTAGVYTVTITPLTNGLFAGLDGIYIHSANAIGTALAINTTPYQENDPALRYIGTWTTQTLAQYTGGTARQTVDPAGSVMFNVDSNALGVAVHRTSGPGWGTMEVCFDDQCQTFPPTLSLIYGDIVFLRVAAAAGPHVVEIKNVGAATPINVEAVRVLGAETPLTPGFYQENDPNVVYTGTWTTYSSVSFNGGTMRQSKTPNNEINFRIGGGTSGFVIFTTRTVGAANMEVCYTPLLPAPGTEVCVTENTSNTATQFTFGFATFGLNNKQLAPNQANDQEYAVSIRHAGTALQPLSIEAIGVLGVPTTTLPIGTYDDAAAGIIYAPAPLWSALTAAVYLNNTVHYSPNAGTLVQMRFTGNSITVFQLAAPGLATNVSACLVIPVTTGNQVRCANFSQRNTVSAFGTPITVYGFGFGTHDFVLENTGGSSIIIDAVQIR